MGTGEGLCWGFIYVQAWPLCDPRMLPLPHLPHGMQGAQEKLQNECSERHVECVTWTWQVFLEKPSTMEMGRARGIPAFLAFSRNNRVLASVANPWLTREKIWVPDMRSF